MKKPTRSDRTARDLFDWWDALPISRQMEIIEAVEYNDRLQQYKKWKAEQSK